MCREEQSNNAGKELFWIPLLQACKLQVEISLIVCSHQGGGKLYLPTLTPTRLHAADIEAPSNVFRDSEVVDLTRPSHRRVMKASELEDAVKTDEAVLVHEPGILRTELLHDRDRVVLLATPAALGGLSVQAAMASVRQALQVGVGSAVGLQPGLRRGRGCCLTPQAGVTPSHGAWQVGWRPACLPFYINLQTVVA